MAPSPPPTCMVSTCPAQSHQRDNQIGQIKRLDCLLYKPIKAGKQTKLSPYHPSSANSLNNKGFLANDSVKQKIRSISSPHSPGFSLTDCSLTQSLWGFSNDGHCRHRCSSRKWSSKAHLLLTDETHMASGMCFKIFRVRGVGVDIDEVRLAMNSSLLKLSDKYTGVNFLFHLIFSRFKIFQKKNHLVHTQYGLNFIKACLFFCIYARKAIWANVHLESMIPAW